MEVKLSELKPNPFRNLKKYPLDKEKINTLKGSIKRNDFWDNVVVRKNGNGVELAYGHHRIEAAKEVLGKNTKVNVIVKDLTNEQMLKVMAADNDDAYRMGASFVRETVEAVLQLRLPREAGQREEDVIAEFLGWPTHRVGDALGQIHAINEGIVSKEALELLPHLKAARAFTTTVKKTKISPKKQVSIAKQLAANEEAITRDAILDAIDPDGPQLRERDRMDYWKFKEYLNNAINKAEGLVSLLQHLTHEKQLLDEPEYKTQAAALRYSCSKVFKAIENLYKGGKNEKTKLLE